MVKGNIMREWIDEKIDYLYSKISKEYVVFEPTKEFYDKLEKIDIIPPLKEVLENIDKNRSPYIMFGEATKSIEKHLERTVPKIEFHQLEQTVDVNGRIIAGKYQVGGDKREIEISSDYKKKGKQLGTILAHEIAHDFLFSIGIVLQDTIENERLTDLAAVMLGFGKLMLNGIEEKSMGATKKLCYLSSSDLVYAYAKVNLLYKVPIKNYYTNLDSVAYSLVKQYDKVNIKQFAEITIDNIEKKCSIIQINIDKIKEVHHQIFDNQNLINKNIGSLKIEASDSGVFINLNNSSFQLDFDGFISNANLKLADAKKRLNRNKDQISIDTVEVNIQDLEYFDAQLDQKKKEAEQYLGQLFEILAVQEKYFPKKSSELKNRFQELIKEGRLKEALKLTGKEDCKLLNDLGVKFAKKKDRIALEIFEKIIQLDPNNAIVYYNRGKLYRDLNENGNAVEDYHKSIELDPNNAEAYYNCGNANLSLKQYHDAIMDYQKAIKIEPNNATAYYYCGNSYLNLKQYHEAIGNYRMAIKLDPNNAMAHYNCGNAHFNLNQYSEAICDYQMAIKLNPDYHTVNDVINEACVYLKEQDGLMIYSTIRIKITVIYAYNRIKALSHDILNWILYETFWRGLKDLK